MERRDVYNLTDIVQKALAACVECVLCVGKRDPSRADVLHTQLVLRSAVFHSLRLYDVLMLIKHHEPKVCGGVKFHGLFYHFWLIVISLGSVYFLDTPSFEHSHIPDGLDNYRQSSKRKGTQSYDMLSLAERKRRATELKEHFETGKKRKVCNINA